MLYVGARSAEAGLRKSMRQDSRSGVNPRLQCVIFSRVSYLYKTPEKRARKPWQTASRQSIAGPQTSCRLCTCAIAAGVRGDLSETECLQVLRSFPSRWPCLLGRGRRALRPEAARSRVRRDDPKISAAKGLPPRESDQGFRAIAGACPLSPDRPLADSLPTHYSHYSHVGYR